MPKCRPETRGVAFWGSRYYQKEAEECERYKIRFCLFSCLVIKEVY